MKKLLIFLATSSLIATTSFSTISCKREFIYLYFNVDLNNLEHFKKNQYLELKENDDPIEAVIKIIKSWPDYDHYDDKKMDENVTFIHYTKSKIVRIMHNPNQAQYLGYFDFYY